MTLSARLCIAAALALAPSPLSAQRPLLPNLIIESTWFNPGFKCVYPGVVDVTINARVKNIGKGTAILPKTTWAFWIVAWDVTAPFIQQLSGKSPSQILPGESKIITVTKHLRQQGAPNWFFAYGVKADPYNYVLESNENDNNISGGSFFARATLCK